MVVEYIFAGLFLLFVLFFMVKAQKDSPVAPLAHKFRRYENYINFSGIGSRRITKGRLAGANAIRQLSNGMVDVYYYTDKGLFGFLFPKMQVDRGLDPRKKLHYYPPFTDFPEGIVVFFPTTLSEVNKLGGGFFHKELLQFTEDSAIELGSVRQSMSTILALMESHTNQDKARELLQAALTDVDGLRKVMQWKVNDTKSAVEFVDRGQKDTTAKPPEAPKTG